MSTDPMSDNQKRIAEACGWQLYASRDQFINGQMQAVPDVWVWEDDEGGTLEWPELPDYFNNANDALEILNHLARNGHVVRLDNGTDTTWECIIDPEGAQIYGCGDTLPLAVCDAFLKWLAVLGPAPQP